MKLRLSQIQVVLFLICSLHASVVRKKKVGSCFGKRLPTPRPCSREKTRCVPVSIPIPVSILSLVLLGKCRKLNLTVFL